jgi:N4-gp56 family major capsid protein
MPHNWTWDSDVGVFKDHHISSNLLDVAMGECKVYQFTLDPGTGFGKGKGEFVHMMHVNPLPQNTTSRLREDMRVPIRKLSLGDRAIRVEEFGEGVEYTNLAQQLSKFKPSNFLQKELKRQMTNALDTEAANSFKDATAVRLVFTPLTINTGQMGNAGLALGVATVGLTYQHCKILVDYMADTIHCPPYEGDYYMGLTCNRNIRSLKDDRNWILPHLYLQKGDFFFKGEMGMTERIRWIEVNRAMAFSNTAGTSTTFGEGVVFGDEGVAAIEVDTPHLRVQTNYQMDFGRSHAAAWYGLVAMGSIWAVPDDGKAKIIRLDSL